MKLEFTVAEAKNLPFKENCFPPLRSGAGWGRALQAIRVVRRDQRREHAQTGPNLPRITALCSTVVCTTFSSPPPRHLKRPRYEAARRGGGQRPRPFIEGTALNAQGVGEAATTLN